MKLHQQGQLIESSLGTNIRDCRRLYSSADASWMNGDKATKKSASGVLLTKRWKSVVCLDHILVGTKLGFSRSWTFDYYLSNDHVLGNIWHFADFCFISFQVFSCLFGPCHAACGIWVPQPGIKPMHPALEVQSLNHWTTREIARWFCLFFKMTNATCWHTVKMTPDRISYTRTCQIWLYL